MEKVVSKDRLKDKFSKVEIAFDDESFNYKITSESVKKIQTHSENARKNGLPGIIWRGIKLVFSSLNFGLSLFYQHVIKSGFNEMKKQTGKMLKQARDKEEKMEIFLDQTISMKELAKKEKESFLQEKKHFQNRVIEVYTEDIQDLFGGRVDDHVIALDGLENSALKNVMAFQIEALQFVSKKLIASNMIMNVKSLNMNTCLDPKKRVQTELSFELDKKGYMWSLMFGKHFVPELKSKLEKCDGEISIVQRENLSLKKDIFTLKLNFNVPVVSVGAVSVEHSVNIPKKHSLKNLEL
jgi:hypothetical protein